jgi:DNA repair exonuclease SbcCD nuclease subunit
MSSVALITDTHYGGRKGSKTFHDYFKRFYEDIFFPELEKRKIKHCIHLGDAFDSRKSIDFWCLNWAKENVYDRFRDLGITVHQIVGNHDAYYKNTNEVNSIESLLREYDNIVPISSPGEYDVAGMKTFMIPWISAENQKETLTKLSKTKAKAAFGHLELQGFAVYPGNVQQHGMETNSLEKFQIVCSGHYHTRSNNGKIFYLGNPYQLFWNDVNDKRGFSFFDTETFELEFVQNPYTMFERIYYEDQKPQLFNAEPYKDKIVKIIVRKKSDQLQFEKFVDKIYKTGVVDIKIVENFEVNDDDVEFDSEKVEDTITILNKYVEDSDFDLDKEMVKTLLREVYQEACEME